MGSVTVECFGIVLFLFLECRRIRAEHCRWFRARELEESMVFVLESWSDFRFFLDGWLNILYFVVFVTIVYILRPTANNKRFAMSEEVRLPYAKLTLAPSRWWWIWSKQSSWSGSWWRWWRCRIIWSTRTSSKARGQRYTIAKSEIHQCRSLKTYNYETIWRRTGVYDWRWRVWQLGWWWRWWWEVTFALKWDLISSVTDHKSPMITPKGKHD